MLCAGKVLEQCIFGHDLRRSVDAQPPWRLEVDEQHSNIGRAGEIAERQKHSVAVIHREDQLVRSGDADEAWSAAFV